MLLDFYLHLKVIKGIANFVASGMFQVETLDRTRKLDYRFVTVYSFEGLTKQQAK